MTISPSEELGQLLDRLTAAAEKGSGADFAACFTADAIYHDYVYGDHKGQAEIAHMMDKLFHRDADHYRWQMFDPVSDGRIGYAWSLSSFTSKIPEFVGRPVVIDGISRFELEGGLIRDYSESVNGGVAMAQLGVVPERMARVLARWGRELRARPAVERYLAAGAPPGLK